MKKHSLTDALATKTPPAPVAPPAPPPTAEPPPKPKPDVIATTIRIDPERLEKLKVIAVRRRIRVNELLLEGVDHVIALHNAKMP
jgi:hypothetical protein